MGDEGYETLAEVYEWLVPDPLLTPDGSVAAFAPVIDTLPDGARVLDCAAGTGQLAVGLALHGFDVAATDASPRMVERTARLAAQHQIALTTGMHRWEDLRRLGWDDQFDAVFCVGNSLTHAGGRQRRRAALTGMAAVLRLGGLLVLTSRNWERVQSEGSRLEVATELVERGGKRGLPIYGWTLADTWDDGHCLDVAVAIIDDTGRVTTRAERLTFWPFTHSELDDDLVASGLAPESTTYADDVERYLVTARRSV